MHRLDRTRDDITWLLFDAPPSPDELASVGVWVDPAIDERDYDGFTAEAMAAGRVVVASRTAINVHRAEKGRTALLVPAGDPNELTHAILAALFKSEVGQQRANAARQTISKFRARQRHRVLAALYETLFP
jgi:glycosyltransferase involved in cell wall biosynthesis